MTAAIDFKMPRVNKDEMLKQDWLKDEKQSFCMKNHASKCQKRLKKFANRRDNLQGEKIFLMLRKH